jgi:FkbM family methyltransferase
MTTTRLLWRRLAASVLLRGDPTPILSGSLRGWKLPRQVAHNHLNMVLGRYERLMQTVIRDNVTSGDCAYDIGANVGFFSLLLASLVGPCGRVHAFEPSPPEADSVDALVRCNALGGIVHVHRMAISDATGHSSFLSSGLTGILANAPRNQGQYAASESTKVQTTTLDDFVFTRGHPAPRFMKIDVESAEVMVLAGAQRVLAVVRPAMLIELHGRSAAQYTLSSLFAARYDCLHIRKSGNVPLRTSADLDDVFRPKMGTTHVVALPQPI